MRLLGQGSQPTTSRAEMAVAPPFCARTIMEFFRCVAMVSVPVTVRPCSTVPVEMSRGSLEVSGRFTVAVSSVIMKKL